MANTSKAQSKTSARSTSAKTKACSGKKSSATSAKSATAKTKSCK